MAILKKLGTILLSSLLLWSFSAALPSSSFAKHRRYYRAPVAYKYVYYPSSQIYYNPVRGMYYYPYSGGWRYGTVVPTGINLGKGVSITLGGPTPYVYHPTVIQQYPVVVVP
jgi:hypothetical protein